MRSNSPTVSRGRAGSRSRASRRLRFAISRARSACSIDIGLPDAARLHKASKAAPRVVVYTHKDPAQLVERLAGEQIHRAEAIEVYAMNRNLIAALVARLDRRMAFGLSIADRELYISDLHSRR